MFKGEDDSSESENEQEHSPIIEKSLILDPLVSVDHLICNCHSTQAPSASTCSGTPSSAVPPPAATTLSAPSALPDGWRSPTGCAPLARSPSYKMGPLPSYIPY